MAIEFEGQLRMEARDSHDRSLADFLGIGNGSKFLAKFAQDLIPPAENPKEWWIDYNIFCLLREEERRGPAVFNFVMGNIAAAYVRFDPSGDFEIDDPALKDDLRNIFYPAARELARRAGGPLENIERLKKTWEMITYLVLADPAAHERGLPFPGNSPFFKETSDLAEFAANPGKDAAMLVYEALQKMKVLRE